MRGSSPKTEAQSCFDSTTATVVGASFQDASVSVPP